MTTSQLSSSEPQDFLSWNMRSAVARAMHEDQSLMTEEEYSDLFDLMAHEDLPPDSMSAEEADGYMTACAIGPDMPAVHEWLPAILGKKELPILPDEATQERLLHLLLRRWRDIGARVRVSKEEVTVDNIFFPLLGDVDAQDLIVPYQLDKQGNRVGHWQCKDWAQGFRRAIFDDPMWQLLLDDKEHWALVSLIILADIGFNPDKPDIQLEEIADYLPNLSVCVCAMRSYWRQYNIDVGSGKRPPYDPYWNEINPQAAEIYRHNAELGQPFLRLEEKVKRNDPCPCGSGKKYKKCCGA